MNDARPTGTDDQILPDGGHDHMLPDDGGHDAIDSIEAHKLRRGRWLGQFQIHYQPIIDVRNGSLIGMEALLRWQHPERGTLTAGNFVPMAERTGMTGPLDGEVLRTASTFRRLLPIDQAIDFKVTVNVVAGDLVRPGVVEGIQKTLEETRLPPALLQLEVSNLAGAENPTALKTALMRLHDYGVALSLDDFEVASASKHTLAELPFQTVKVDFNEAHTPEAIQAMIEAVAVAHERQLRIVAKRVETADHLRLLRTLDVHGAQGYALGPPVRSSEFQDLLRDAGLLPQEQFYDLGEADAA